MEEDRSRTVSDDYYKDNPIYGENTQAFSHSVKVNGDESLAVPTAPSEFPYDVCIAFPTKDKKGDKILNDMTPEAVDILRQIAGVVGTNNILIYRSIDGDKIFALIRISMDKLKNFADLNEFKFLTDPITLRERCSKGWEADQFGPKIEPLNFADDRPDITKYGPYEYIYLNYKCEDIYQELYAVTEGELTPFSDTCRIRVLYQILEDQTEMGGLQLKLNVISQPNKKHKEPIILGAYALHHAEKLFNIQCEWFSWRYILPYQQPLKMIKEYFGEKIALYYAFLGHFAFWILIPAITGLAWELVVAAFTNVEHPIIPFYCIFIVLWGVFMLEFWKRREKFIAMENGMLGYEQNESYRGEFEETEEINLTGKKELYFSPKTRNQLVSTSFIIMFLLCCMVVGTTAGIYVARSHIASSSKEGYAIASIIASILNAIQVQVYAFIYSKLSKFLTDRENHRTDTEYEDSMIAKDFIFAFINSYTSFFYIAFFASRQEQVTYPGMPANAPERQFQGQCGYKTCMQALSINLGIVLAIGMIIGNFTEAVLPYIFLKMERRKQEKLQKEGVIYSPAELEYNLEDYTSRDIIGDYLEIVILFGFMTMFVSALPGSAFVVLFSLWLEIKVDAWSLLNTTRRPWPKGAEDIGTWQAVLDLLIATAVVTNAGMIVFTMQLLDSYTTYRKFWFFIGFQWVVFSLQYIVREIIPDIPFEVTVQEERAEYMNDKLMKRVVEETEEELIANMGKRAKLVTAWSTKKMDALNVNSMIAETYQPIAHKTNNNSRFSTTGGGGGGGAPVTKP